ncbi:MAG: FG-GAP-like repeat-containing protein, partial [Armatimonadetes bacterium]|nr:FG-GAP-like repeat-containing protein [Armatimonadota bacterium]
DYNNDGSLDALVSGDGDRYDKLFDNDGGAFTDVAAVAGFTTTEPGRTVSWCDYNGDNRLDVFVSYVSYPGYDVAGRLYRNDGGGTFTDVSASVGMGGGDAPMYAFGSHWGDYDNDGWSDLLVSSWNLPPMLYHNQGDGTFTEVSTAANLTGLSGGTGAAWGDYDNDGWLDAYIVANGTVRDGLFHNNGDGTFTNVAGTAGMAGDAFKANGVSWADYDTDGYLDIVVGGDRNTTVVLYHNDGDGTFTDATAGSGLVAPQHSGSTVWADMDLDGRLDLFHAGDPDSVMSHNIGAGANWLRVRALTDGDGDACDPDPEDSRDALGARVELNVDNDDGFLPGRTMTRVIDGGSGFLGQNEPVAQFGVPTNGPVAVRVFFPDGSVVTHRDVALNAQIEIRDVSGDRVLETFPDVPLDSWAYEHVEACVDAGIVSGYDDARYHGDWPVTREQMAAYISRALAGGDAGVPAFGGTPTFADVPAGYWALRYVEYAASCAIVGGYDDGLYHPEYSVDRGQMAVFVARSIADPTGDGGLAGYTPPTTPTFADVPTDFWSYRYVEYIADPAQAIVSGYWDGLYHHEILVARDQMAVYIAKAFGLGG